MNLILYISVYFLLNDIEFFLLLHLHNLCIECSWIISLWPIKSPEPSGVREGLHEYLIIQKVDVVLLRWFCQNIEGLYEFIFFFFNHLKVGSLRGLMFEIYVIEIGKIYIHFAYIFKKFSSIQNSFSLNKLIVTLRAWSS